MAAALVAAPASTAAVAAAALAPVTQVDYEMNEPPEATLMLDSSGNNWNAPIDQNGLDTGVEYDGAIGYYWTRRNPNEPPPSPERIIQIPDSPLLDPGADTFTIEIRYRTKEKFGNITQKGQSASRGGQWKIQNPQGMPSCLFKGSLGRAATRSKVPLNDNEWHVLTCVREPTRVTMYVDGVYMSRKNGMTGTIDNQIPMTVGGKINCNQVTITCDYFSGMIDYHPHHAGA
ncbi:MAG: LamG-like jellyroll fold domain-containing protein [Nocardioides sp.]